MFRPFLEYQIDIYPRNYPETLKRAADTTFFVTNTKNPKNDTKLTTEKVKMPVITTPLGP